MLQINGKTFMNIQEAVQWLLDNNALPFQSSANYIANTEIGMGTIVNPSPAKVRIGSLIFFADSKVSTVTGLTENGFIVSDQYNDLVDDVVYVSNVMQNASGHLIVTLSNGNSIDAGLIKQVSSFAINASQHLIVTYNDGSTSDLGAIFQGNVNISGTINATLVTGDAIVENMVGYSFTNYNSSAHATLGCIYAGVVKNGNKITFVVFGEITRTSDFPVGDDYLAGQFEFTMPSYIGAKLYNATIGGLNILNDEQVECIGANYETDFTSLPFVTLKSGNTKLQLWIYRLNTLTLNQRYTFRYERTFLLSENLAS